MLTWKPRCTQRSDPASTQLDVPPCLFSLGPSGAREEGACLEAAAEQSEQSGLDMLTGKASKVGALGWPVQGLRGQQEMQCPRETGAVLGRSQSMKTGHLLPRLAIPRAHGVAETLDQG